MIFTLYFIEYHMHGLKDHLKDPNNKLLSMDGDWGEVEHVICLSLIPVLACLMCTIVTIN